MANQLKTIVLLGGLTAVLVGLGGAFGEGPLIVATAFALLMNVGAYFYSDRIVLAMHHAVPVEREQASRLHRKVERLAARVGIPMPRLYVVASSHPNAFATGRDPAHAAVAVTEGLLGMLNDRELDGVLAHELSHVRNRDILVATVAAVIASAVTSLAHMMQWGAMFGLGRGGGDDDEDGDQGSPLGALLLAFVAPLAATLIQLAISRSREYQADATAAHLLGDASGLASALAKLDDAAATHPGYAAPATASLFIVNPMGGLGGAVLRLFSTHPPIAERIRRLREVQRNLGPSW